MREGLWQNHQVGLHIARGEPGGWTSEFLIANSPALARAGFDASVSCGAHDTIPFPIKNLTADRRLSSKQRPADEAVEDFSV